MDNWYYLASLCLKLLLMPKVLHQKREQEGSKAQAVMLCCFAISFFKDRISCAEGCLRHITKGLLLCLTAWRSAKCWPQWKTSKIRNKAGTWQILNSYNMLFVKLAGNSKWTWQSSSILWKNPTSHCKHSFLFKANTCTKTLVYISCSPYNQYTTRDEKWHWIVCSFFSFSFNEDTCVSTTNMYKTMVDLVISYSITDRMPWLQSRNGIHKTISEQHNYMPNLYNDLFFVGMLKPVACITSPTRMSSLGPQCVV